jgi:hypothetical protein
MPIGRTGWKPVFRKQIHEASIQFVERPVRPPTSVFGKRRAGPTNHSEILLIMFRIPREL